MSGEDFDHREGHVAAWRTLNDRVAADLKAETGYIKPAKVLHRLAHPKIHIGHFAAKLLRMGKR